MRYEVDPDRVRSAGEGVGRVAVELSGVQPEVAMAPLAEAFRGSLTAVAVGELGRLWSERVLAARLGVRGTAVKLTSAAGAYSAVEEVARRSLGQVSHGGAR